TFRDNSFSRNIGSAYIQGSMFKDVEELIDVIDSIILLNIFNEDESLKVITPDILKMITNRSVLEADLPELVENNRILLECQPITDMKRVPFCYEVFPNVDAEKYQGVDSNTIFDLASQTGVLKQLCYRIFDLLFTYLSKKDYEGLRLEIALPLAIFADNEFVAYLKRHAKTKNFRKDSICLNLCNKTPSPDIKNVIQNVNLLSDSGYLLAIDNFCEGYIDFDFLTGINYKRIKITGSLLASAVQGAKNAGYLSIIYAAIGRLSSEIVQKGIDNKDEYSFASVFEVAYGQGSYLSKKMPIAFLPSTAKSKS
ncbi:MAG: EAL domain-containing protein, partial [Ruminococcaceae bacterium]|nr:EAL domain-containing protein [Oscillospiraceae bacterium]